MPSREPAIAASLGPERFADYVQATGEEHQLNRLVNRLELPLSAARAVADVKQATTQRASEVRANPRLDDAARDAELNSLAQSARTKITVLLGARGGQAYEQFGGAWLQLLQPRGAPPKN